MKHFGAYTYPKIAPTWKINVFFKTYLARLATIRIKGILNASANVSYIKSSHP